jgi:porphobilinogen synthase
MARLTAGIDKFLVDITFFAKSSFSSANPNFVEVLFRFTKRNFSIAGNSPQRRRGHKGKRGSGFGVRGSEFGVRGRSGAVKTSVTLLVQDISNTVTVLVSGIWQEAQSTRPQLKSVLRPSFLCVLCAAVVNSRMYQLTHRPRRLRSTEGCRRLVRETRLEVDQLIYPIFVSEKISGRSEVPSMPDVHQFSLSAVADEVKSIAHLGIPAVLLFGIPSSKDELASQAYAERGIAQEAIRAVKSAVPELIVITDVCLCEYMSHGHCGIVEREGENYRILNDETVELLAKTALSHAAAGADIVAPSDMMDGRIGIIRKALDGYGFCDVAIMSYAAKFCSAFYGPFREAAESAPQFGDRRTYQMDPANALEALREVALDLEEGADLLIVKPGLPYLDILWRIKERFKLPTAVYNVSGEYAMLKAASKLGWLDEKRSVLEMMTGFRRAGADMIITYWAKALAKWMDKE